MSVVYVLGHLLKTLASVTPLALPPMQVPDVNKCLACFTTEINGWPPFFCLFFLRPGRPMTMAGLFLIAVGTGGIKPCVSAFGGDQFKLPEQARQASSFFSTFYFAINLGSLLSTILTPILR